MNAPEHELLVHISAPSSVKDDRRYMSLAQSILEFQPAFATKVSGADWIYSVFTAADEHHDPTRDRRTFDNAPDQPRPRTAAEARSLNDDFPPTGRSRRRAYSEVLFHGDSFAAAPNPHSTPTPESLRYGHDRPNSGTSAWEAETSAWKKARLVDRADDDINLTRENEDRNGKTAPQTSGTRLESLPRDSDHLPVCQDVPSYPLLGERHAASLGLSRLPDEVCGPVPRGGRRKFITHLTKPLEKLVSRIPLSKHFRPMHVARDINVLERGHWRFSVRIVEETVDGDSATRTPGHRRRLNRPRTRKSQEETVLWTEKEFVQFWHSITPFIQGGRAGWGTRVIKDYQGEDLWMVRLFTWGELLGHLWLVLWVLSDKLTGGAAMQWVAGDNAVVVQMSGRRHRRGQLGPWVRKGPAGEGGVWGIG